MVRSVKCAVVLVVIAGFLAVLAAGSPAAGQEQKKAAPEVGGRHVPEVLVLLSKLEIDKPRTYKHMVVFPIRFTGTQASGQWETLDQASEAGHLKIAEQAQARVSEVAMQNEGDKSVFIMSGEIIKGGKQTRVVRQDTVLEAKQKVDVAVFCIEQRRWRGGGKFNYSSNLAPAAIRDSMNRGASQTTVWRQVEAEARKVGARSATESLDEVLDSDDVQRQYREVHRELGKFSPPDTIGIAVADSRTGRVVGLELFGRRDLFEQLQDKLIEGYATDLVLGKQVVQQKGEPVEVTQKNVRAFIGRALAGTSRYIDTPGSGRGIDLTAGTLKGKGVALGDKVIHLSIQAARKAAQPAKPIVTDPPAQPSTTPVPQR